MALRVACRTVGELSSSRYERVRVCGGTNANVIIHTPCHGQYQPRPPRTLQAPHATGPAPEEERVGPRWPHPPRRRRTRGASAGAAVANPAPGRPPAWRGARPPPFSFARRPRARPWPGTPHRQRTSRRWLRPARLWQRPRHRHHLLLRRCRRCRRGPASARGRLRGPLASRSARLPEGRPPKHP